jgi:hypothetical protein
MINASSSAYDSHSFPVVSYYTISASFFSKIDTACSLIVSRDGSGLS